jgi:hypothetical protein
VIDCRQTAKRTIAIQFSFGPGADIGLDVGLTFDFTYKLPFAFTGKIDWVTVGLKPQRAAPVAEAAIPMSEAGRCCSLIPGLGVKLLPDVLPGPLFSPR